MTEKEFLRRYNNGDHFNNKELAFLLHEFQNVKTTLGSATQDAQEASTIISVGGRYFLIDWYIGLGDCEGDDFYCSPREIRKKRRLSNGRKFENEIQFRRHGFN